MPRNRISPLLPGILRVLLARGSLSKDEIVQSWGLDEEDYAYLKAVFLTLPRIEPGPAGTGGFKTRAARGRAPPASAEDEQALYFVDAAERAAAERLAALLSHEQLEKLLGDLAYTVRLSRRLRSGQDRRGSKLELAAALVIRHGHDLFSEPALREQVARKCNVKAPQRWVAGKSAALAFVQAVQFPPEFAGLPSPETPPDVELFTGRMELPPLADFQKEVQAGILARLREPEARAMVMLPTGAGKTRVAVDSLRDWLAARAALEPQGAPIGVLWLAHTEELCEQAMECFEQVWRASAGVPALIASRLWGGHLREAGRLLTLLEESPGAAALFVSTPARIVNLLEAGSANALTAALLRHAAVLVVDEAHRAAAPSYQRILEAFSGAQPRPWLLGLSATPYRKEYDPRDPDAGTRQLARCFGHFVEAEHTLGAEPRLRLQDMGVLARPVVRDILTGAVMQLPPGAAAGGWSFEQEMSVDEALRLRADNPARRQRVLEDILPEAARPGAAMLYFGPSVLDAECMAFLLRERGIAAAAVSGQTSAASRARLVRDFKAGALRVLCNCEVLTTGFDAPRVTHVVMARPTVSQVLYEQMVGRGLRGPKFGGTDTCTLLDCEDNYRGPRPVLGYQRFRELWGLRR